MTRQFHRIRARRIHRRALSAWADGDREGASALAEQALAVMPGGRKLAAVTERINVLFTLASLAVEETSHRAATTWLKQAASELGEAPASPLRSRWFAEVLTRLGDAQRLAGDYDGARATLQQAHASVQGSNADCLALAGVFNTLGILAKETGRYDEAADRYGAALQLSAQHSQALEAVYSLRRWVSLERRDWMWVA